MSRSQRPGMLRMRSSLISFLYILTFIDPINGDTPTAAAVMSIFAREPTPVCPAGAFDACPNAIPFCCQTGTTCVSLVADHSSVLCCPDSAPNKCQKFQPVPCDIQKQNQTANPAGLLFTHNFDIELPKCGSACCPLGYTCNNGQCHQSSALSASTATDSSTAATSSSSPLSTMDTTLSSTTSPSQGSGSNFPPGAVIVGLVSGLLAGALITIGVFCLLRRRREGKRMAAKLEDSPYLRGPQIISDPFTATAFGTSRPDLHRTDSGRYTPATSESKRRSAIFAQPLKFGLPLNPKQAPQRPLRSDENVAGPYELPQEHEVPSSAHLRTKDDDPIPGIDRQNSDDSYITTGSRNSAQRASTETISVGLMPPPLITGERQPVGRDVLSTNTTFSQMMQKAGMRGRENAFGNNGYPGRYSFR